MELLVILTAILLLVGSISVALPSKSSRKISKIRIEAKKLGFKITSTLYGKNSFKNKKSFNVFYQIKNSVNLKEGHFIRDKDELILYSPVKLKYSENFCSIKNELKGLTESIDEIIFTSSFISFLWKESDGIEVLKAIQEKLESLKNL
jgi:hypothetical protein|tara:strand:+ start:395 stop:838 length:444 start_codon:yes stop_codon:yes gene_type:complete